MSAQSYGRTFWIAVAIGAAVMAYGAVGLVSDAGFGASTNVVAWLAGADVANDVVLAPLACLVGAAVARVLPRWCRAPVQAALLTTGVLLIVVFPALRGYGRDTVPDNLSVDPLDYTTSTLTALAVVWAAAGAWLVLGLALSGVGRHRRPTCATPRGRSTLRR
jgi:hypothetical protein